MSNKTTSASATGLPTRRLFLAAGSAAAVFAGLGAAVAVESPDAALIAKGNAAYAAFFESLALPDTHDADAQSDDLYDLMRDNAEDLCSMQARALEGVKAKARADDPSGHEPRLHGHPSVCRSA
jgi:hypothetical protein